MNILSASKIVNAAALADHTVIISGAHGCGKSSIVKQYAKESGKHCVELFLSHMEMGDVLGLPRTSEVAGVLTTTWSAPDWIQAIINRAFPAEVALEDLNFGDEAFKKFVINSSSIERLHHAIPRATLNALYCEFYGLFNDQLHLISNQTNITFKKAQECVLFLDELNRAPIDVRQGTMQLILEKELHCHKLPFINGKQTQIVAAINPAGDYQTDELDPALLDRFVFIEVEADAKIWLEYARARNLNDIVRAYIAEHPKDIFTYSSAGKEALGATPRSWEKLADFMNVIDKIQPEIQFDIFKGIVGTATASKFLQFFNNYSKVIKLADVEKAITKAKKKDPSLSYVSAEIAKLLEKQEAIQKMEMAEQFYAKYINKTDDAAYPLLAYLYSMDIELLAAFLKQQKANDMTNFNKLAKLDEPNGKELFKKVVNLAPSTTTK